MSKKDRRRFWMCYVDGGDIPRCQHLSKTQAQDEAERLAKKTGKDVFLLDATHFVRYIPPETPPEIEWQLTSLHNDC